MLAYLAIAYTEVWQIGMKKLKMRMNEMKPARQEDFNALFVAHRESEKAYHSKVVEYEKVIREHKQSIISLEEKSKNDANSFNTLKNRLTDETKALEKSEDLVAEHSSELTKVKKEHFDITTKLQNSISQLNKELNELRNRTLEKEFKSQDLVTDLNSKLKRAEEIVIDKELKIFELEEQLIETRGRYEELLINDKDIVHVSGPSSVDDTENNKLNPAKGSGWAVGNHKKFKNKPKKEVSTWRTEEVTSWRSDREQRD